MSSILLFLTEIELYEFSCSYISAQEGIKVPDAVTVWWRYALILNTKTRENLYKLKLRQKI